MPTDVDEWIERLTELINELDLDTITDAYAGNAAAKAVVEAWALEMQGATLFLATYQGALQANVEALIDIANTIIDSVQAILIAIGIVLLLKRLKKSKNKGTPFEIVVTLNEFKNDLGTKVNPIPQSKTDKDKATEALYLKLRIEWVTHFMLTVMQALKAQASGEGKELVWRAKKDGITCSVCRFMDGKKSINGDFLPVIMKQFPSYKAYVGWMGYPHAHPRCRCHIDIV